MLASRERPSEIQRLKDVNLKIIQTHYIDLMATPSHIIQSKSDSRRYHSITLHNHIQCLLVQDEDTELSSAALSMGVGSFKDPKTAQGIAHYLEHMLFMGTEKYPDENDYSNVL